MLVLHIRHDEETEENTENWEGVRQSQLVQWLLFANYFPRKGEYLIWNLQLMFLSLVWYLWY